MFNIPGDVVDESFIDDAIPEMPKGEYLRNWQMGHILAQIHSNISKRP
jgi:hypothetical protein